MRKIQITEEVWAAIASRGRFGESEDDVLRRVFNIPKHEAENPVPAAGRRGRGDKRFAQVRMSARVEQIGLIVEFQGGKRRGWPMPNRTDKSGIRKLRDDAVKFALENGASDPGQTNAVRKALTDAGYHLTK